MKQFDRAARTRVRVPGDERLFLFGSGCLVAPGRVLTAAHVLAPEGGPLAEKGDACEVLLRGEGDGWLAGIINWVSHDWDLAVLTVPGLDDGATRVRWGHLSVEVDDPLLWKAVGWPIASLGEGGRQPEHAFGETSAITLAPAKKLGLTIGSRVARPDARGSGWAGLSGAGVFCGELLVGVITADSGAYEHSLTGVRIQAVSGDAEFIAAVGLPVIPELVVGRPLEPGLRDLWSLLPARPAVLIGRDEELRYLCGRELGGSAIVYVVSSLSGMGRTALAAECAHRRYYDDHSVDIAWWFSAEDRNSLARAMAAVYEQLTGQSPGQEPLLLAAQLRNWLERCPYRWLLVFTNPPSERELEDLIPQTGYGQVIISCRPPLMLSAHRMFLTELSPSDAERLLMAVSNSGPTPEIDRLARELQRVPIALVQAGAYIRKTHCSVGDYIKKLRSGSGRLYAADIAGVGSTTAMVWETSLKHLTDSGLYGPLVRVVLGVLAYLGRDDIPRTLFEADSGLGDPVDVELALAGLAELSLITLTEDAINVHPIVQAITWHRNIQDHSDYKLLATAVRMLAAALARTADPDAEARRLIPHILRIADQVNSANHSSGLGATSEEMVAVLNTVAANCLNLGDFRTASSLLLSARRLAETHLTPDHPGALRTRSYLAYCQGMTGQVEEAVSQFRRVLDDYLRVLGPDHPDTLATRSYLAHWMELLNHDPSS